MKDKRRGSANLTHTSLVGRVASSKYDRLALFISKHIPHPIRKILVDLVSADDEPLDVFGEGAIIFNTKTARYQAVRSYLLRVISGKGPHEIADMEHTTYRAVISRCHKVRDTISFVLAAGVTLEARRKAYRELTRPEKGMFAAWQGRQASKYLLTRLGRLNVLSIQEARHGDNNRH